MSNKLLSLIFAAVLALPIGARAQVHVIPNAGTTGTATGQVAKVTGAPSTAVRVGTTDTTWNGIVVGETTTTATTGSALLAIGGQAACIFDGGTTAGDFVQISGTTAGDCHDAGATFPTSGSEVLGTVLSTNASGGTYTINVFSPGIPAAGAGGTITGLTGDVTASGSGTATATVVAGPSVFCNGGDGDLTGGSGTTTLAKDMCYRNVTLSSGDKIYMNGFALYVSGTLDLSAADTGAIQVTANSLTGGNASTTIGGTNIPGPPPVAGTGSVATCSGSNAAGGSNGTTTTGNAGTAPVGLGGFYYGGDGHVIGAVGGAGASAAGAASSLPTNTAVLTPTKSIGGPTVRLLVVPAGVTTLGGIGPGQHGAGGSAGGGDGTHGGGGSGGGGACGGTILIAARTIARGTNTNASIIAAKGGTGGAGAAGNASCTNCGGGAGGNGGGGGHIVVIYENITGSTITNALDASSGAGGAGSAGTGGASGTGGTSGSSGGIEVLNLGAGTYTATAPGSTYNVGSGTTGGASKTAQQSL